MQFARRLFTRRNVIATSSTSSPPILGVIPSFISPRRSPFPPSSGSSRYQMSTDTPATTGNDTTSDKKVEVGVAPPKEVTDTIFGKITRGEIPVKPVYEDEHCVVINDLNPQAPVHMLVLPRKPITQLSKSSDEDAHLLGQLLVAARKAAKIAGLSDNGYRVVINDGKDGCQSVYHLHIHVLGGRTMNWPPG